MLIDRSDDGLVLTGLIPADELTRLLGLYVRNAAGENWPRTATKIEITLKDKNRWPLEAVIEQVTVSVHHRGARRLMLVASPAQPDVTELVPVHAEDDGA